MCVPVISFSVDLVGPTRLALITNSSRQRKPCREKIQIGDVTGIKFVLKPLLWNVHQLIQDICMP